MLESNQIVAYDDPSKTFLGVRFVLLGFESVKEDKVRLKLLEGGGIDAVNYGPDCNHVIVDKLVYDDPMCVAARRDGKTLVTGLWVDHSYDVGMPVDSSSVMYRPMMDLNGIPGAKSLVVCLTGYQRQDRDDIMTMVALMGANFSKPLVANKVTHLICYKFEGEKYELAKKMKKIKLVNHRWLEDCLKSWELLPEADYDKSGYELEMMAEAKDSEDETEDPTITDLERKNIVGPLNTLVENRSFHHSPAKQEISISRNSLHSSAFKSLSNDGDSSKIHSTPERETHDRHLKMPIPFSVRSPGKSSPQVSANGTNISEKVNNALASATESSKKSPDADVSKSSSRRKCKGTPTKHTSPLSLASNVNKLGVSGGFDIDCGVNTPLKGTLSPHDDHQTEKSPNKNKTPVSKQRSSSKSPMSISLDIDCGVKTPLKGALSPCDMGQSANSPNKSKTTVSRGGSKLPMLSHDPKIPMESELATKTAAVLASGSSSDILSGLASDISPKTRSRKEASPKEALSKSCKGLKKQTSRSLNTKDISSVQAYNTSGGVEIHQSDVQRIEPPVDRANSVIEKMDGPDDLNITNERNTGAQSKPIKRKLLAKKTLGSRPTISKGTITKLKGSLNLQKAILQIDNVMRPNGPVAMESTDKAATVNDETKTPSDNVQNEIVMGNNELFAEAEAQMKENSFEAETAISSKKIELTESKTISDAGEKKIAKGKKRPLANAKTKKLKDSGEGAKKDEKKSFSGNESKSKSDAGEKKIAKGTKRPLANAKTKKLKDSGENVKRDEKCDEKMTVSSDEETVVLASETNTRPSKKLKSSGDLEKENDPATIKQQSTNEKVSKNGYKAERTNLGSVKDAHNLEMKDVPACFILSGHRLQRKEFQQLIRRLKGRVCRDSHNWSYQATHFIVPDPIRRTEKFFAAAASGSWILKTDYLTASNEAGRLLSEEPYEWHKKCLTEDGAINLEAPRKWRLIREKTGHGAFYGMRIVIYGECIAPPLDTLKRVIKAGEGTILATSPPYTRFFGSRIDFAIVSPGMPRVDMWVQEFLTHEVPCVVADYLVEYVCKPGYPLDRHVQYNTHAWAAKSLENLVSRVEEVVEDVKTTPQDHCIDDVACNVCGSRDRGDEMLICGDESGNCGCGVGAHFDCLDPPLECVPEEDWFCTECSVTKESKSVGSKKRATKSKK